MSIERIGANDARAARGSRRWRGLGSTAGLLAFGIVLTTGSPAFAQRVTVTIGGYGASPSSGSANATTNQGAAQNAAANPAGYAQAAWAGAAAYARYMQYLNVMNYQATHGGAMPPGFDVHEYFTNGAEALTIPTAGPGSAYFANGSETTIAPTPNGPPAQPPSYAPPPTVGAPPSGQSPWVVVVQNPNATAAPPPPPPPPAVSASAAPPPPPPGVPASPATTPTGAPPEPPADTRQPVVAMSFDDWLQSMGYTAPETAPEAPPTELTSAVVETGESADAPVIAEPAAFAYDVRPRVAYVAREKARAHIVPHASAWGTAGGIASAFAAGLLLGGWAMLRMRDRVRRDAVADATTTPR